jgi:hypothetical protein
MLYFNFVKVEDVDKKFEDLQQRKEAGWIKKSPEVVKKLAKVSVSHTLYKWAS